METYKIQPCEVCKSEVGHDAGSLILCERGHIIEVIVERDPLGFNEYQEISL